MVPVAVNPPCPNCESSLTALVNLSYRPPMYFCGACGHEWTVERRQQGVDVAVERRRTTGPPPPPAIQSWRHASCCRRNQLAFSCFSCFRGSSSSVRNGCARERSHYLSGAGWCRRRSTGTSALCHRRSTVHSCSQSPQKYVGGPKLAPIAKVKEDRQYGHGGW